MSHCSATTPLFPDGYRASGMLLHVTSLPSPYGVGDLGPVALSWIELLERTCQSWWQSLPLGPTGYGNSPYQPLSSFAVNALVVSPDWLVEDELVKPRDMAHPPFSAAAVDYDRVIPYKHALLEKAWENFQDGARSDLHPAFQQFCQDQNHWLADYALFRTLKKQFNGAHYLEWPAELVRRDPEALGRAQRQFSSQVGSASFAQFLLFRQAERLKTHAHNHGLRLIGDLPFFVSPDSSDVWANPQFFLLDQQLKPRFVAGVPPDYFSAQGQLWGNPVYDWDALREAGYRWWIDRLRSILVHVDAVRLDHFRGFTAAWHVPAKAATAQSGKWVEGPGADFWQAAEKHLGDLPFIAEDLGSITPEVYALRDQLHLPGMRVLQFAFDGHPDNPYLAENYVTNTVVYTGTHDNPTTREWFDQLTSSQRESVWKYVRGRRAQTGEVSRAMMEVGWSSIAGLALAPLQDLLNLGGEARMNVPGRPDGNWRWRCTEDMLSDPSFEWLSTLTRGANRQRISIASDSEKLEAASTK